MPTTYAIADLHGRSDLLEKAIAAIEADGAGSGGAVVFLGDYVDRGPDSRGVVERLMAGPADPDAWAWHCLKGNHEHIMVQCLRRPEMITTFWERNGGIHTLLSYGVTTSDTIKEAARRVPHSHIAWLEALPLMHVDEHRVFVHAGVVDGVPLEEHEPLKVMEMLYPLGADGGHGHRHVVHGHDQAEEGPELWARRSNLDTLAWITGRLVVGVFDDNRAGGPTRFIEITCDIADDNG